MVLNRNEQRQMEGLFTAPTLAREAWNGKYGTKHSSITARDYWTPSNYSAMQYRDLVIDTSTYRSGIDFGPTWKDAIANHEDAGTPFAATRIAFKQHSAAYYSMLEKGNDNVYRTYVARYDPAAYCGQSYFNYVPLYDTSRDFAVDEIAIRKFYDRVGRAFDGTTFLGELSETIRMFRKPLADFHRSLDKQLKKNRRLRAKAIRDARNRRNWPGKKLPAKDVVSREALKRWRIAASSSYLEWKWGVVPLMHDIQDAFEALGLLLNEPTFDMVTTGHGEHYTLPPRNFSVEGGMAPGIGSIETRCHTTVRYKAKIYTQMNSSHSLSDALIGPPDAWIPTLWELMPYSWLIDYGTTVGEALNAFITARHLRYVFVCKTVRHTLLSTIKIKTVTPSWNYNVISATHTPGVLLVEKKHVSRNPLSSVPLPSITWKHKLSDSQASNLVAYVASMQGEGTKFRNRNRL